MNADTKEFLDHWWAKHGQEIFDFMVAKINSANEARKRADQENERLIDAWMCDETIGESGKKASDGRIIPDGSLRPHIRKTIERAEHAEKALREAVEICKRTSKEYKREGNTCVWEVGFTYGAGVCAEKIEQALASLKSSEVAK